ncbi:MAG: biotin--[acetyl-CoA-carboxylase] ligase [Sphaerochaetaceae bacterium]|jgi:BirA family biotin operon repressor/biotin-[acetyl-CoA-carboxylase] ligase
MRVKDRLLVYFERHAEEHVSGERLASLLGVSRAAVWKAIQELKRDGYRFSAVTNKGYRLEGDPDVLSRSAIMSYLSVPGEADIRFYDEVESTNKTAKLLAMDGAAHGTVVVAARQTGGRGRRGRSFASPEGGIYISVILKPSVMHLDMDGALLITSAVAVAVSRAISTVCGIEVSIKWVNDLFYNGRKVCGILSEGVSDFESGGLDCIVVGVGVNFSTPLQAFPDELREIAGSLFPSDDARPRGVSRSRLAGAIISAILAESASVSSRKFLEEYRRRSFLIGQSVQVLSPTGGQVPAQVLAIDDDCRLVVRHTDGSVEHIGTGEVSIRFSPAVKALT